MSGFSKTNLGVLVGVLGILTCSSSAAAAGGPVNLDAGFHFNLQSNECKQHLAPWYTYFPYEAYFQVAPPVGGYPHWPTPFPPPGQAGPAPRPMGQPQNPLLNPQQNPVAPQGNPANQPGPSLQPVGYYHPGFYYGRQVPAYWYGR